MAPPSGPRNPGKGQRARGATAPRFQAAVILLRRSRAVLLNLPFFARRDDFSMDGTGVPVPEHLWFVGQVPDLPLLQNLSMAGREPAPPPSPNVETPDTGRNYFLRGDDRLRRSHAVPQRGYDA